MSLLIQIAPLLLGVVLLYASVDPSRNVSTKDHLIIVGASPLVGSVTVGALYYTRWHLNLLDFPFLSFLAVAFFVPLGFIILRRLSVHELFAMKNTRHRLASSRMPRTLPKQAILVAGTSWIIVTLIFSFHEAMLRPPVAWDSVTYWSKIAENMLTCEINKDRSLCPSFSGRHPFLGHAINTWASYSMHLTGATNFLYVQWFMIYVGSTICAGAFVAHTTNNSLLGISASLLISTAPMIETHSSLGGYAELWIACSAIVLLSLLKLVITRKRPELIVIWILLLLSTIYFKLSGGIIIVSIITSYAIVWLVHATLPSAVKSAIGLMLCIIPVYIVSISGLDTSLPFTNQDIDINPQKRTFTIGNFIGFYAWDMQNVATKLFSAIAIKSSFYLSLPLILVTPFIALCRKIEPEVSYDKISWLILMAPYLYLLIITILLGTSPALSLYSSAETDTSLTRSLLPWYGVNILSFMLATGWRRQYPKKQY